MRTRLIVEVDIPDDADPDVQGFQMIRNVLQLVAIWSGCGFGGVLHGRDLDEMDPHPGCPSGYAYNKHYDVKYWWEHQRDVTPRVHDAATLRAALDNDDVHPALRPTVEAALRRMENE